jgi:hypothetical protein
LRTGCTPAIHGLIAVAHVDLHFAYISLPGNLVVALAKSPNETQYLLRLYQDAVTPYRYYKIAERSHVSTVMLSRQQIAFSFPKYGS